MIKISLCVCFILWSLSSTVFAASIHVTHTLDELENNGLCSLREAIINTNNDQTLYDDCPPSSKEPYGKDSILLPSGVYCLSLVGSAEESSVQGDLDIRDDLTISGEGAQSTIIDAGGSETSAAQCLTSPLNDRVIHINEFLIDVSLSDLTVTGGYLDLTTSLPLTSQLDFMDRGGGGINSFATLFLNRVVVTGNTAVNYSGVVEGGGIKAADVTIIDGVVSHNKAMGLSFVAGGGLNVTFLVLDNTVVSQNMAVLPEKTADQQPLPTSSVKNISGGGLYCDYAIIDHSTISDNISLGEHPQSRGVDSGGMSVGVLVMTHSTVSGNIAKSEGQYEVYTGGLEIFARGHSSKIINSTISHNQVISAQGLINKGGGIVLIASELMLAHTTITQNGTNDGASIEGAGIYLYGDNTVRLINTIISGNNLGTVIDEVYCPSGSDSTLLNSYGYNFITNHQNSDCVYAEMASPATDILDKTHEDLLLDSLKDNGGKTQTHALKDGSLGRNSANCKDIYGNQITIDQRGYVRETSACDVGAFDLDATEPVATPVMTTNNIVNTAIGCQLNQHPVGSPLVFIIFGVLLVVFRLAAQMIIFLQYQRHQRIKSL